MHVKAVCKPVTFRRSQNLWVGNARIPSVPVGSKCLACPPPLSFHLDVDPKPAVAHVAERLLLAWQYFGGENLSFKYKFRFPVFISS